MQEEVKFYLEIAPHDVWLHLADFSAYRLWHPSYRFEGNAEIGNDLKLTYTMLKGAYKLDAEAAIIALDRPRLLAWKVGVGGPALYREMYELQQVGTGTEIRHLLAFESFMGKIVGVLFRRIFRDALRAQNIAFANYLKKKRRAAVIEPNRHSRRSQNASTRRADHDR